MAVYKEEEFQIFLKMIEGPQTMHWMQIAEVLGIDKNTVTAWKKLPEAREAIGRGLTNALSQMEFTGKNDWRMWMEKSKMLGIASKNVPNPELKVDPRINILNAYGLDVVEI